MAVEPLPLAGRIDITEDDILRLRAEGWDYVPTNMPSTYRPYWDMFHAIREFVQNSLDETETFDIRLTSEGLEISDQGSGFFVADLLLHYREKPKWARGQFGEGLKIACIVALKNGFPLYIWTTDKVIRPLFLLKRFIERGEVHEARVVYFFWHPFPRERGTTVLIQGYKGEMFLDRFVQKLPSESFVFSRQSTIDDHRFTHSMIDYPVGTTGPSTHSLYVRDIYVSDLWEPTLLSYNLWRVDLDPDRVGLKNPRQVENEVKELWGHCTNKDLIRLFLNNACIPFPPGPKFFEAKTELWVSYENKGAWQEVWAELFGVKSCYRTTEEMARRATHLGWKVIEAPYEVRYTLRHAIKSDADVVEEEEAKRRVPISSDMLTVNQQRHLALVYWLQEKLLYLYAVDRTARPEARLVVYATLPHAGEQTGDEIRLRQDTLNEEVSTVETFIHELAHYTSDGAEDLTEDHVHEMEYLSWLLWTLRERPNQWDLWDAMMKHDITPKFKPRGVRPKVKPIYPIKSGDMIKVVSGAFKGIWGRVTKVSLIEATGSFVASIRRPESPEMVTVLAENLAPFPEKASLFSVGDVVRVVPSVEPYGGHEGEVYDILTHVGAADVVVMFPRTIKHTYHEFDLVYLRTGPLITKATPQIMRIPQGFVGSNPTREGIVRGKVSRNIQRLREKLRE